MSVSNRIQVFQNNVGTIGVTVTGITDITGYAAQLTVKKKSTDATPLITSVGSVIDPCTFRFGISSTDSSIAPGDYVYDINMQLDNSIYTITKDVFTILDGILY